MAIDLSDRDREGLPEMAWRPPSPDLGPQAQGHLEQRMTGFSPSVGKKNGETRPPWDPPHPFFASYPLRPFLSQWDWLHF